MPRDRKTARTSFKQLLLSPEQVNTLFENIISVVKSKNPVIIEAFTEIFQNIVQPVINSPVEEIGDTFERYLTSYQIQIKNILELINEQDLPVKKLNDTSQMESKEFFEQFQNRIEKDFQDEPELGHKISDFVYVLSEYSHILILNNNEKPDVLDDVLSYKIDINELQKYILRSLLAFFCILLILTNSLWEAALT